MVFPFIIFAALLTALTVLLGGFSGVSAVLFCVLFFVLSFWGCLFTALYFG